MGGHRGHAQKNTQNWANRVSLAKKAKVAASPKILQLELWRVENDKIRLKT